MSTLSEQIVAKQAELVSARDVLVDLSSKGDAMDTVAVDEATASVDRLSADLDRLKSAEAAIQKSLSRGEPSSAAINKIPRVKSGESADLLIKNALVTFDAYVKRIPVEQALQERFHGDEALASVVSYTKAAQNPAMSNVAGYAQELTRESYGAFMDLLRGESVVPQLPLNRYEFNGYASIKIPARAATPNMAGAFRAEGAPIRVGGLSLTSTTLTPKSLAVIGTWTNELMERSTPSILEVIRNAMIEDTAQALDAAFLGNAVASATTPAGIQQAATAGNTAASAGATTANIMADVRARLQAMTALNLGRRPVFIMNPARWFGVKLAITAAGTPAFPEAANNTLMGIPVVTSTNVPAAMVYLVDAAEISFAGGAPAFMGTEVATLHEEDTAPLPVVGSTGTVAQPVRSLYQTNSSALRTIWQLDWAVMRAGSVQTISAAAW